MQCQDQYEIDIFELAGRLGMTRYKYPSQVLSKLQRAVDELTEQGYLSDFEVFKVGKYTSVRFEQATESIEGEDVALLPSDTTSPSPTLEQAEQSTGS